MPPRRGSRHSRKACAKSAPSFNPFRTLHGRTRPPRCVLWNSFHPLATRRHARQRAQRVGQQGPRRLACLDRRAHRSPRKNARPDRLCAGLDGERSCGGSGFAQERPRRRTPSGTRFSRCSTRTPNASRRQRLPWRNRSPTRPRAIKPSAARWRVGRNLIPKRRRPSRLRFPAVRRAMARSANWRANGPSAIPRRPWSGSRRFRTPPSNATQFSRFSGT